MLRPTGHTECITLVTQTDNHASTPPLSFLQAGCPSCHQTNNVKALKANPGVQTGAAVSYLCACVCRWQPCSCCDRAPRLSTSAISDRGRPSACLRTSFPACCEWWTRCRATPWARSTRRASSRSCLATAPASVLPRARIIEFYSVFILS